MRVAGRVALLVVLWLLAWGELSVANLLSGVAVAGAVLVAFPLEQRSGGTLRFRARGVVRLGGYIISQLVVSNVLMTRHVLSPTPDAHPGVLSHRLQQPSEEVVTVMTSVIALSPGTMVVDVDAASTTIYVHFFRLRDVAAARASLDRLERLVTDAIVVTPMVHPMQTSQEQA